MASSKATSPVRRYPLSRLGSSTRFMPTSITYAPGLIQSPRIISARPMAAMRISASRQTAGKSFVREWQMVVVALAFTNSSAAGIPTMFDRPTTTAFAPSICAPAFSSRIMHPAGVQGTKSGSRPFCARRPMFTGWKPSTSFSMLIVRRICSSSKPGGSGSWTRIPCTLESAFSF